MASPSRPHRLADIPVLIATPAYSAGPLPTVLWFHGFRADALAHAAELERCADAGFLAVGVDAVGHGGRRDPAIADRIAKSPGGALPVMLGLVDQSIAELPSLVSHLATAHGADVGRVSAVGISMGAFLTYGAIADGMPLRAAVALLGSPVWPRANSPHENVAAFRDVALLSVTAEHDASVPPHATREFHRILGRRSGTPAPHAHHELRGSGHLTSARHWAEAMDETIAWLERHAR